QEVKVSSTPSRGPKHNQIRSNNVQKFPIPGKNSTGIAQNQVKWSKIVSLYFLQINSQIFSPLKSPINNFKRRL
ncbi:hypothetical protein M153_7950004216, partial [Pseudoloma neurophilia]